MIHTTRVLLRGGRRALAICAALTAMLLATPPVARSLDRTDIPLQNWGGFAVRRDQVYDDLERLVTAGFGDREVLNTKPISRTAAARIVARAIQNIRADTVGRYSDRSDLEDELTRLTEEFKVELAAMGVKLPAEATVPAPGVFSFTPIDRAMVRAGYASRDFTFPYTGHLRFQRGANGGFTFESRAQIGDVVTFYLQPELHLNEEFVAARLQQGYVKLTLFNVELTAGRENLWWGPGLNGSLILSNNAAPLDHVRLGAAEPFLLPWIGDWIGPTKILAFFARLEKDRDIPHAEMAGLRGTISPFSFLELGVSYVNVFGGDTPPTLRGVGDYFRVLFDPIASDQGTQTPQRFRNNALFAIDADLRLTNVNRYYIPARDLRIYGEFGWDDTCCSSSFIPLADATSYRIGVHALNLLERDGLDWRFEYTKTGTLAFTHNQFFRGYWSRGEVISDVVGTDGWSIWSRVSQRLSETLMVGASGMHMEIGNTTVNAGTPKEERTGGSMDVSWAFGGAWSLFVQGQVMYTNNRNFVPNEDGWDGFVLAELTRSFR
jgi:hypothetical protein